MSGSTFPSDKTSAINIRDALIAAIKAAHSQFNKTGSNANWLALSYQGYAWLPSGSVANMTAAQNESFRTIGLAQAQSAYTAAINQSAANNNIAPSY